ncbi:MAG: hypothetical protein WD048_10345 [Chitinophagales bacterium]
MQEKAANKLIEEIRKTTKKKGFDPEYLVTQFKELRKYALEEQDPTVTKVLRLSYEFIGANESFMIGLEEFTPESDEECVDFFLQLLSESDKPLNREEIKEFRDVLKDNLD